MKRLTSKRDWIEAGKDLSNELGYSHIWRRLKQVEDILGDDYDLDRLRGIVEADRRKRERADAKCGSCAHFHYIGETKSGKCGMREGFTTFQSRGACKMFINRAALVKETDHE